MSKTTLLLALFVIAAGLVIGIYIIPRIPLYFADYTLIWRDIQAIPTMITTFIQDKLEYVLSIAGIVGSSIVALILRIRDIKSSTTQAVDAIKDQAEEQKTLFETTLQTERDKFATTVESMSKEMTKTTEANVELTKLNTQLTQSEKQTRMERDNAIRDLKALQEEAKVWYEQYIKTRA